MAYAAQATTHYQTYPEAPGADLRPKKVCNLDPMARSRQKRNYPRAPRSRRGGVGTPYYPTDSQLQVYDIYTTRRVLWCCPR